MSSASQPVTAPSCPPTCGQSAGRVQRPPSRSAISGQSPGSMIPISVAAKAMIAISPYRLFRYPHPVKSTLALTVLLLLPVSLTFRFDCRSRADALSGGFFPTPKARHSCAISKCIPSRRLLKCPPQKNPRSFAIGTSSSKQPFSPIRAGGCPSRFCGTFRSIAVPQA